MCRVLGISRSGYYRWLDRPKSLQEQRREAMEQIIVDTFEDFQARYGAPRLVDEIRALGYDERFYRMWRYFLLGAAGSDRARRNQLWQIVYSKRGLDGGYESIR